MSCVAGTLWAVGEFRDFVCVAVCTCDVSCTVVVVSKTRSHTASTYEKIGTPILKPKMDSGWVLGYER